MARFAGPLSRAAEDLLRCWQGYFMPELFSLPQEHQSLGVHRLFRLDRIVCGYLHAPDA